MNHPTNEQIAKINKVALAEKHKCSDAYVHNVLRGIRDANTEKAKAILKDAIEIIRVLEGAASNQQVEKTV